FYPDLALHCAPHVLRPSDRSGLRGECATTDVQLASLRDLRLPAVALPVEAEARSSRGGCPSVCRQRLTGPWRAWGEFPSRRGEGLVGHPAMIPYAVTGQVRS